MDLPCRYHYARDCVLYGYQLVGFDKRRQSYTSKHATYGWSPLRALQRLRDSEKVVKPRPPPPPTHGL